EASAARFVGRVRERAQLAALVSGRTGPAVVFVSGPGGVGKSALVAATVAGLAKRVVTLDGRTIEPTPGGFLSALAHDLRSPPILSPSEAGGLFEAIGVAVLVVDSFERLNLLDAWLRNDFLPALPAQSTTVLVGRRPANVAWRAAPGWRSLLAELVVGELADDDAAALIARHGLPVDAAARVRHFGRGHPLALEIAAEAVVRHGDLDLSDSTLGEVIEELFQTLIDDLDPAERRTVETASILRRVTRPLLTAVLDRNGQDVDAAWRTLCQLPFTSMTRSGLELDPLAHNVIAGGLEISEPAYVADVRRRGAEAALRDAGGGRSWDGTADLLYLVQNPIIRNSYVPPGDQQHPVERAVLDDRDAIMSISVRHDGAAGTAAIGQWWTAHQENFMVYRGASGEVAAFSVVVRLSEIDTCLTAVDPVVTAVLDDVRKRPLPPEAEVLLLRSALGRRRGEYPSPELGSLVVDLKRLYLELRPRLSRVYSVVRDWDSVGPVMRIMGFGKVQPEIPVGNRVVHLCALDFGPGSVDGWLARHVLVESGEPVTADQASDPWRLPAPVDRAPVARLSAREREVLTALADGLTNVELADRLFISERTANRHLSNIFTKLGVRNRTSAARIAIEAGLAG
ncbi:MAG: LuxR family transcriptional regulator, partial [Nakamurella sp.]